MSWLPKRCVLVPVDFSPDSHAAAEAALQMVDAPRHLHVIHVLPPLAAADPGAIWGTVDDEKRTRHAEKILAERLRDSRFAGATLTVAVGDPGSEIASHASRIGAELIVIPSHGRTGLPRLLIGSVAERVVRFAECPVLVLKRPVPATDSE